jgi:hypothetical protein
MSTGKWADENGNPMYDRTADDERTGAVKIPEINPAAEPDAEARFKVIETDTMTGWKQYLDNMSTEPWLGTFTRERAEASVKWREENITRRYSYRIVPVEPFMNDNGKARERHDAKHGSHRMEDCSDVDCREAALRLSMEEFNRLYAATDEKGGDPQ